VEFVIEKREVHVTRVKVIAESAKEALRKAMDGEGEEIPNSTQYSDTVEPSGVDGNNRYQWRVFGPGCDKVIGCPASMLLDPA
jgi:hypothetical protein